MGVLTIVRVFGNMCTYICCVLYCLYCVFVLFRLCIFILICFVCASENSTAVNNNNNNNNNKQIKEARLPYCGTNKYKLTELSSTTNQTL